MRAAGIMVVIIAAVLAEAVWETFKPIWDKGKLNPDRIGALVIGIIVAVAAGVDLCAALGLQIAYPIIGQILTGILISRGANFVHDLLKGVQQLST